MKLARLVSLTFALVLASNPAAAQERRPADVQTVNPITVQSRAGRGQAGPSAAAQAGLREIPLRTPASAAALTAAKRQAATDPRVGVANQALGPSVPGAQIPASLTAS